MAITFQGSMIVGKMYLQPGERTSYKRNGIVERSSIYLSRGYPTNPPVPLYTPYPDALTGGFVADQVNIESVPGGFYRTSTVWVSIAGGPNGLGSSYVTYQTKVVQLPIEQSPNFFKMAGIPSAPQPGASWTLDGRFLGFVSPSPYLGVVSFFATQHMMIIHGSSTSAVNISQSNAFLESSTLTVRGGVLEYEFVYNRDMNANGIPIAPIS
jgi:hypothetical protein